jgi:nitroreductase
MNNPVARQIHPLLARRRSAYVFDPQRTVGSDDLRALLEAARWSMSSYNAQPWRYIVGVRDRSPLVWEQVFSTLLESNQAWARHAPVLLLGLAERRFEYNGKDNKAALHDLGAASASLTFEATARGLAVHQMTGIEPHKARRIFDLGESIEPFTALAIGYPGSLDTADAEHARRDRQERERKPLEQIILHGSL